MVRKRILSAFQKKKIWPRIFYGFGMVTIERRKGSKISLFRCTFLKILHIYVVLLLILNIPHKNSNFDKKKQNQNELDMSKIHGAIAISKKLFLALSQPQNRGPSSARK